MKKLILAIVLTVFALSINAQTKTPVKVSDLNKAITYNVATTHAGYTIKEAKKVEANGVITYEVKIVKGTSENTLIYDKDGKFLKREMVKAGAVEKKVASKKEVAKEKVKTEPVKK